MRGVLSVDISDWSTPGLLHRRPARECTADEIAGEVWHQMRLHLRELDPTFTAAATRYHLDSAVTVGDGPTRNAEPLFINTAGSWKHRPAAATEIENLFVAGDFARASIDIATMETANESARRAVNAILERSGNMAPACPLWSLPEPAVFEPLRRLDAARFREGRPALDPGVIAPEAIAGAVVNGARALRRAFRSTREFLGG